MARWNFQKANDVVELERRFLVTSWYKTKQELIVGIRKTSSKLIEVSL